jgi:steroid 5-alpha reductase family enzyme
VITAPIDVGLWVSALPVLLAAALLTWLLSLPLRSVAIADSIWGLMLFAAGVVYALGSDPRAPRLAPVLWLTAAWAIRLTVYLAARSANRGEQRHHQALRARHGTRFALKSLYLVFVPRALLAWVVSLPLLGAFSSIRPVGWLDSLGILFWLTGFVMETTADWQLARFHRSAGQVAAVLDRGLWRYSRHPNYFGEACLWWGVYLMALSAGAWWALPGPLLLCGLLWVAMPAQERECGKRMPQYADYVLKTNGFFPGPPRN